MAARKQPNWETVASEWEAFVEWVVRNHGAKHPHLREHVEAAIEEWTDLDGLRETESLAERITELCPHERSGFSRAIYSYPDEYDRESVSVRLDSDLLDEYCRIVDEDTDHPGRYGYVLAKVLYQYRIGGRTTRINDRLREAIDVLAAAEIELPDDYTPHSETDEYDPDAQDIHYADVALHRLDKRTRTYDRYLVCQNLAPDRERNLHMNLVRDAVRENVGDAPAEDDGFIRKILSTLNFVPHPRNPNSGVYVHEDRAEEITQDQDTDGNESGTATTTDVERIGDIDRRGFHDLSPPERLTKIRLAFAKEMYRKRQSTRRFEYNYIKDHVFENHTPSASYANKAIEKVDTNGGAITFVVKHGRKCAEVSLAGLKRECPSIWAYVSEGEGEGEASDDHESTSDTADADDVDGSEQQADDAADSRDKYREEAEARMDDIMNSNRAD